MSTDGSKITLTGHLQEFRSRLLKSIIAVVVATVVSFFITRYVLDIATMPIPGVDLIYVNVTEMISVYMKVAIYSGIVLALPYIIYQGVMFVAPALKRNEKVYLYVLLPSVLLTFAVGVLFAYFVLLPPALNFLIEPPFAQGIAEPQIRIESYISVIIKLVFALGLVFEIPIVIFFLSKIGVVNSQMLAKYRKFAIIGAFVLAAIITPTFDPVNQSLVAIPVIVLYEVGIWLSKLARREKKEPAAVEAEA